MRKLEKYTGNKLYMFPNGKLADKSAVMSNFPAAFKFVHVVETDENGEVMWAFQNLSAMRTMYEIDPALTEEEAIAVLEEKINAKPEVVESVTAEERIAAALEFQVMASLPDEEMEEA